MVEDKDILKTGTTTVAIRCKDGIVMCADKRATAGYLMGPGKVEKIFQISETIGVTGAGMVSDVQLLVKVIRAELKLKTIREHSDIEVKEAVNLLSSMVYHNIRKMSMVPGISHFLIAGRDENGYSIYDLGPDGSALECDTYVSSGSGSVMAYGVLDTLYKENMTIEEGMKLGAKAINAAVQRDIASGNGIDIVTITKDGLKKVLSKEIKVKIEI